MGMPHPASISASLSGPAPPRAEASFRHLLPYCAEQERRKSHVNVRTGAKRPVDSGIGERTTTAQAQVTSVAQVTSGLPAASPPSSASWSKQCCTPSLPEGTQRRFRAGWPAGPRSRARWPNSLQALMAAAPWRCQAGRRQVEGRRNAWLRRSNGAEGDGEQKENVARTWGSVPHGAEGPMLPTLRLGQTLVGCAMLGSLLMYGLYAFR